MKNIGSIFLIFGALAIVLGFFDSVPRLLMWIYNWGETMAWVIKIGLVVVGGALWFFGKKDDENEETQPQE